MVRARSERQLPSIFGGIRACKLAVQESAGWSHRTFIRDGLLEEAALRGGPGRLRTCRLFRFLPKKGSRALAMMAAAHELQEAPT